MWILFSLYLWSQTGFVGNMQKVVIGMHYSLIVCRLWLEFKGPKNLGYVYWSIRVFPLNGRLQCYNTTCFWKDPPVQWRLPCSTIQRRYGEACFLRISRPGLPWENIISCIQDYIVKFWELPWIQQWFENSGKMLFNTCEIIWCLSSTKRIRKLSLMIMN